MALRYPDTKGLSEQLKTLLYIRFGYDPVIGDRMDKLEEAQASVGAFWLHLFAAQPAGMGFGIRLVPGNKVADCPLVRFSPKTAVTHATSGADSLAWLVYHLVLGDNAKRWSSIRDDWSRYKEDFQNLQVAMGPGGNSLDRLHDVLFDDSIQRGIQAGRFRNLAGEIWTRIDDSPQFLLFWQWYREVENTKGAAPALPNGLGPWRPAAATLSFGIALALSAEREAVKAAWEVVQQPAALDNNPLNLMLMRNYPLVKPIDTASPLDVARYLSDHVATVDVRWRQEPLWEAVVTLATKGTAYDGSAHLTAARQLHKQGRSMDAMAALTNAAYWSAKINGVMAEDIQDAVLEIANQEGWEPLVQSTIAL